MVIKNQTKVEGVLPVRDPYILSAYHYDLYPKGNGSMGVHSDDLKGKKLGQDFDREASWRMYHGQTIPGFPYHPHRGFEIVTIALEGFADHFDSKGSKGRYGNGDVQLMSAGKGVQHGEMFPLLNDNANNPLRLFQIWVNLPAKDKLTEPQYKMLWSEKIPKKSIPQPNGRFVHLQVILGQYNGLQALDPLPHSWAKDPAHHMGIALVDLDPDTSFTLPAVSTTLNRFIFFYDGEGTVQLNYETLNKGYFADADGNANITLKSQGNNARILILEGEPINEPVAAYGPFVMNTEQELRDAFKEYRQTQFGGWPWGENETDAVNPKDAGRFASYNHGAEIDKP